MSNVTLFAQPYDISAVGFYFNNAEEYVAKASNLQNDYGDPVEEFEIQFIDGDAIDCALAKAININQTNITNFLQCAEDWDDWQKFNTIIAVGEFGYTFAPDNNPDHYDIDLYFGDRIRDLAEQFVEEGLYGDIPDTLQFYIDYDAIARDLAFDFTEAEIAGERIIYASR